MIYIFILFLISLVGLCIILGRRVALIRNGVIVVTNSSPLVPEAKVVQYIIIKNIKKYSFVVIAVVLRIYIRSSMTVKKRSAIIAKQIKSRFTNHFPKKQNENKEVSGFLKSVSDYKRKIKDLKHKIREEEKNY